MPATAATMTKLSRAFAAFGKGEGADGHPLDMAKIAADTHAMAQTRARELAKGQARAARNLRGQKLS